MIIIPAIDIKDGKCVRLYKGDFSTAETVSDSFMATAKSFAKSGAEWVHMVDLDGAKTGEPVNSEIFKTVARETSLKVEVGGGIRSLAVVDMYLESGIERVILGSAAIKNPDLVKQCVAKHGERIVVAIDAEDGIVRTEGWLDKSEVNYLALAREMIAVGVKVFIFTDIAKDGTLGGVNVEDTKALQDSIHVYGGKVIASGGVSDISDIQRLSGEKIYGAICGKSLYAGTLNLADAISRFGGTVNS